MENESDVLESLNPEEVVEPESTEEAVPETADELAKAKELAQNYKIRAEKAEALAKSLKPKEEIKPVKSAPEFTIKDIKALSDVHDDDVDEIIEFAKFKGISVAQAKKNPIIINTLKENAEQRVTAQATNTGTAKRGVTVNSDEILLDKLERGEELPDDDIEKAVKARLEAKRHRT